MKPNKSLLAIILFFALLYSIGCKAQLTSYQSTVESVGDYIQIGLPAIGFVSSLFDKNEKSTKEFILSFGTTLAITHSLKYIIHKKRPDPSMSYDAFPSGHSSAAFNGATYIFIKHGWKVGIPSYLLAGFVAYSRIEARRHDVWDVLAGASLGTLTAILWIKSPAEEPNISIKYHNSVHQVSFQYPF